MGVSAVRRFLVLVRADFSKFIFPAILLVSAGMRLLHLDQQSLWFDETYTAFVIRQAPDRMLQFLITDGVHPPLYYGLMAVWVRLFGDSAWSLRLPSALCGVLAVWMIYLLARRMAGQSEALLAAFLLGISPFFVWYSQDARMYSLECLAAVTAIFCFWSVLQKADGKNLLGLIVSHAALYGIHYFGVFIFLAEAMFLVLYWRKYIRRWIPFLAAQLLALSPLLLWGYVLLRRVNGSFGIGWIPKPEWTDPVLTILNFFTASGGVWNLWNAAAGLALVLLFGAVLRSSRWKESAAFGVFWLFLPILMAWFLSQQIPVYIDRYLILSLPAAVVLAAIGAGSLSGWKRALLTGLLAGSMLPGLWNLYIPTEVFQKEEWRQAAESVRKQFQTGDLLLLRIYQEAVPLQYYGLLDHDWKPVETNGVVELPDVHGAHRCFVIYWLPSQSAHSFGTANPAAFEEQNPLFREWLKKNLVLIRVDNIFHGIVVLVMEPVRP